MMMYQVRRNGRYFLRPVSIDGTSEHSISREEFFARWRRNGGNEADIQKAESTKDDIDVF